MNNMPKPGKASWKKQYHENDFRGGGGGDSRRVSFKPSRHGKKDTRDWSDSVRAHFEDEDVDMMGMGSSGGRSFNNKKFYKGKGSHRSDSPAPNFSGKRRITDGPLSWYRITLPYGNKYDKKLLLTTLMNETHSETLWPIAWKTNGTVATFYVDDYKLADKLLQLDRQLQMPDGFKLIIRVHPGSPNIEVTDSLKEKMKLAMAKRYNSTTKALDLTKFHADPDLQDTFCAISKPVIFLAIIDIISENIPELQALNLHDNKIILLHYLRNINKKLAHLKILHLSNNKIRDISMLDILIGLPLVELVLDGNPLCDKFKDKEEYVSDVRKRFPKVIKLDGIDLPPPISFDISSEVVMPAFNQTFLCDQNGELIVRQFLQQYFLIYDTDNRQPLLQAYDENAIFSLTMSYPYKQINKDKNLHQLNWYNTDNRNLIRLTDKERREKLLKQGRLAVVSFLQEMPCTRHDIHSFKVDLTLFTPQMITLTISGIFKEIRNSSSITSGSSSNSKKKIPIRAFFRTLIIVPAGTGFCIINDLLHITNATEDQIDDALKIANMTTTTTTTTSAVASTIPPTPVNSPSTITTITTPLINNNLNQSLDNDTKLQMVQAMANQSGMNMEWSAKCLEETLWDYNRASTVFIQLQKQGVIPAEAFIK